MPGIKEVKHSTKTASSDSKSEDLHDDLLYIFKTPNKIYNPFKERIEILPLNQIIKKVELFRHQIQRAGIKYTIQTQKPLAQSYKKSLTIISEQF